MHLNLSYISSNYNMLSMLIKFSLIEFGKQLTKSHFRQSSIYGCEYFQCLRIDKIDNTFIQTYINLICFETLIKLTQLFLTYFPSA